MLLVIMGDINDEFENLSSEVLEDYSKIHQRELSEEVVEELNPKLLTWSTSTDTLSVVSLFQQTMYIADGELETCFC